MNFDLRSVFFSQVFRYVWSDLVIWRLECLKFCIVICFVFFISLGYFPCVVFHIWSHNWLGDWGMCVARCVVILMSCIVVLVILMSCIILYHTIILVLVILMSHSCASFPHRIVFLIYNIHTNSCPIILMFLPQWSATLHSGVLCVRAPDPLKTSLHTYTMQYL